MLRLFSTMLFLLLAACSSPADIHETRFIMGTLVKFTIMDSNRNRAESAIAAAAVEMQRIEGEFTIYGNHPNAVKTFNASTPGSLVNLPDDVTSLLSIALKVKQKSGGAFNPALGKLNLLWGFSKDPPAISPPDQHAIKAAIPPTHCIEKHGAQWLRTDARCELDFGGIAKGYAIDRGIAILQQHGIHNAIINAGGDIRLIGRHGKRPWRIGIRHPRHKNEVIASLELQGDVSIVTSGDYERFYMFEGKRYHHLIDPETGWPSNKAQSATIMAANATLADAWSTALFIQGAKGVHDIQTGAQKNMQALLIDQHGNTIGGLISTRH